MALRASPLDIYWNRTRMLYAAAQAAGKVHVWALGKRLYVLAPASDTFPEAARTLAGKFLHSTGVWSFPFATRPRVLALCEETFGEYAVVYGKPT